MLLFHLTETPDVLTIKYFFFSNLKTVNDAIALAKCAQVSTGADELKEGGGDSKKEEGTIYFISVT